MARSSRYQDIYPISLRELELIEVTDINPGMRRLVFTGDLHAHERDGVMMPELISDGFDDDVRIIFPHPDTGERPYPAPLGDGNLDWTAEIKDLFRAYTVRTFDKEAGTLTIDFARHGSGLAEDFSATAAPGQKIWIAGPKNCGALPTHTEWLLLVGDETALPAISRCLEELPESHPVTAVIEVAEPEHIQQLATRADARIHWCVRSKGESFAEALRHITWREGIPFLWAAGEALKLRGVRAFAKEKDIPREHIEIHGYWREVGEDASSTGALMELAELAETTPAIALQAAASLGIFPAIADGATSPQALAERCNLNPDTLLRFLRYLAAINLVELSFQEEDASHHVQLSSLGALLADPESPVNARLTGVQALLNQAMFRLEEALRRDSAVPIGFGIETLGQILDNSPHLAFGLAEQESAMAGWTAPALAANVNVLSTHSPTVAFLGPGAAVYADEVLRAVPEAQGIIAAHSAPGVPLEQVARLDDVNHVRRDRAQAQEWEAGHPLPAEAAVIVDPFSLAAPAQVPQILAGLGVQKITCISALVPEAGGDEHDYEQDLQRLCLRGTKVPTQRDLARAIAEAGFVVESATWVGWGKHCITAVRADS